MPTELTVTELVRNFAHYLNRVTFRAERFIILRSNKPVAELRPLPAGRRLGDLAGIFESMPRLTDDELDAFARDIEDGRSDLVANPIRDPWASS